MAGPGLDYEILGAVKVKDGLFIGDELAAGDLEFIVTNKVTRVINCAGRQVPNHWESIGVAYLTYYWVDADNQVILDQRDVVANEIFRFIEESLAGAESVLIHSVRGQSRSCCVLSAYMMKKYSWGLRKTMEFLSFRRPDMNLKPAFLDQLSGYESCLIHQSKQPFSMDWNSGNFKSLECEDLLLRNTYINSQMGPPADFQTNEGAQPPPRKIQWRDEDPHENGTLEEPAGADRHNLQSVDPSSPSGYHLRGALKKGTAIPGIDPLGPKSHSSHQQSHGGPHGHQAPQASAAADAWAGTPQGAQEHAQTYAGQAAEMGASMGSSAGANGLSAAQAPSRSTQGPVRTVGGIGPSNGVPEAWAEGDAPPRSGGPGAAAVQRGPSAGPAEDGRRAPSPAVQVGDDGRRGPMRVDRSAPQQRPATNIRDSLVKARRDNDSRPPSRDPSPKTSIDRADRRTATFPATRGESPLRYPTRRGTSPGTGGNGGYGGSQRGSSGPPTVSLSGVRTTSFVPSYPATGARPSQGMGAFRSGGPVRAKADVMSDTQRRPRPQTAPSVRSGTGSRPASPLHPQRSSSSSNRPPSPQHGRPSQGQAGVGPTGAPRSSGGYPTPQTGPRNIPMRRAPSPTPAFNRPPSPSKPRWRS